MRFGSLTKAGAMLGLAATALTVAAPAEARWRGRYYGGYHRGGGGAAVAAGIIGLGLGAALASSARPGYRGYYGYGGAPAYYGGGGYGPGGYGGYYGGPGYYAPPPPPPVYGGGYCREDWRWDGWRGQYVRVRYCD